MAGDHRDDQTQFPPRSKVHITVRGKWSRRFVAALVVLFAMFIVFLIGWNVYYMP